MRSSPTLSAKYNLPLSPLSFYWFDESGEVRRAGLLADLGCLDVAVLLSRLEQFHRNFS